MLLQHYSWQQFLIAALLLSFIWYAAIVLAFYKKEIIDFLNGRNRRTALRQPVPPTWDEEPDDEAVNETDNLMGKPVLPEGMSKVSMGLFGFVPTIGENEIKPDKNWETAGDFKNEQIDDVGRERQQGVIPDIIEELKRIFHILETTQGTKEDFTSLFALIRSRYPNFPGTSSQQALNKYIRDNVLFPISDEELDSLWQ